MKYNKGILDRIADIIYNEITDFFLLLWKFKEVCESIVREVFKIISE